MDLSGAIIFFSLMLEGKDFLNALKKYIHCPFSSHFPRILGLQSPAAVYKRGESFDKDKLDDEWNLIYATFI